MKNITKLVLIATIGVLFAGCANGENTTPEKSAIAGVSDSVGEQLVTGIQQAYQNQTELLAQQVQYSIQQEEMNRMNQQMQNFMMQEEMIRMNQQMQDFAMQEAMRMAMPFEMGGYNMMMGF